jgi:hypothetical protein
MNPPLEVTTMKLLLTIIVTTACLATMGAYEEFHCAQTNGTYDFTDPGTWEEVTAPNSPDAVAIVTGGYWGGNVSLEFSDTPTAAVLRVSITNAIGDTGNRVCSLQNGTLVMSNRNDSVAYIIDTSVAKASTPLRLQTSLDLLVDQTIVMAASNKPVAFSCQLVGSGTVRLVDGQINLSQPGTPNPSPDFTGTVAIEDGATLFCSGEDDNFTNPLARAVVKDGGTLSIRGAQSSVAPAGQWNCQLVMEDGGRILSAAGANGSPSNIVMGAYTVIGENLHSTATAAKDLEFRGDVHGTGVVRKIGDPTENRFLGSISPGIGAGTLTLSEEAGTILLGMPSDLLTLNVEDGDLLEMINMGSAVDLANIDVVFLEITTPGMTNWFLTADGGIANQFNSTNFVSGLTGAVIYDSGNNRVGAVVVPEPIAGVVGIILAALAWRRMQ